MALDSLAKPVDTPVSPVYRQSKLVQSTAGAYALCLDPVTIITIEPMKNKDIFYCTSASLTSFTQLVPRFKSLNYLALFSTRKKNSWPWDKAGQKWLQFDIFARNLFIDIVGYPLTVGMLN
jgi:hypothetical protein